jgi:hypothetical protein
VLLWLLLLWQKQPLLAQHKSLQSNHKTFTPQSDWGPFGGKL